MNESMFIYLRNPPTEMAQWVKGLAIRPEDLSSIPIIHKQHPQTHRKGSQIWEPQIIFKTQLNLKKSQNNKQTATQKKCS